MELLVTLPLCTAFTCSMIFLGQSQSNYAHLETGQPIAEVLALAHYQFHLVHRAHLSCPGILFRGALLGLNAWHAKTISADQDFQGWSL